MAKPRQEVRERWATGRWIGSPQLGAAVTAQLRGVVAAWEIVEPRSAADFGDAVPDVVVDATAIDPHDGGPVPSPAISSLHRLVAVVSEAWCGVGASPDVAARQGAVVSRQRALALACAASGPTVNTIVVPDGFPATARSPRAVLDAAIAPADLAHVLAYFLDPANGYVLGQMVSLCGGADAWGGHGL
ncbi:MAG: hypothetical protein KDB21_04460 [Acidimicrobiales bacterium]|nr:hypothetical protein [Acidimicrobiales bacterium]